jgi:Domain of unknown function (DUF5615)
VNGQYLLDEHLPRWWGPALVRLQSALTIWHIGDPGAPPLGTLDPALLEWCEAHDFLLVTNNRRSMPGHLADHLAAGRHVPGILLLDLNMTAAELANELALIAGAGFPDEFSDRIQHLPLP